MKKLNIEDLKNKLKNWDGCELSRAMVLEIIRNMYIYSKLGNFSILVKVCLELQ